jgi:tungstate transport system substrate-binding protein
MSKLHRIGPVLIVILMSLVSVFACQPERRTTLRLATTTSTYDSGLLDEILPEFEAQNNLNVEVIAVGTGQALALGERGDVDVVLVHDPLREEVFIAEGHGVDRTVLMYNDFIVVGPQEDPAGVRGLSTAAEAFKKISAQEADFASRGDQSGTHARETQIWEELGFQPTPEQDWYLSLGQGMGATLQFANERRAYTLTDRGTFLAQAQNLPALKVLVGGDSFYENQDESLLNCYAVILVNPEQHPSVEFELAVDFMRWITDPATKAHIGEVGLERFGQPLFFPADPDGAKPVPGSGQPASR